MKTSRQASMIGTACFEQEWWDVHGVSDETLSTLVIELSGEQRSYYSKQRGVVIRVTLEVLDEGLEVVKALRKRGLK